jgi:arsenite methyltransferase
MMTADAKFWDRLAEKYAKQPVANLSAFERKQAITREHLHPDASVLEIGCGTGSLALALSPFAGTIDAWDFSSEMIRIAKQKAETQGVTNVHFRQGTLDGPAPSMHERYDSAWAYSILHLVPDRRHTLRTIFQLLKPGGVFISSNVCLAGGFIPYGLIIGALRWFGKAPKVYLYDRETIFRELREAGFVEVEERDVGAGRRVAFVVARRPT